MLRTIKNILVGVALVLLATLYEHSQRRKSMTRTRKGVYLWLCAVMIIVIGNLLQSCARYIPEIPTDLGYLMAGRTICDNRNREVVLYNTNLQGSPNLKYTLIHEHVHAEQARRLKGGCNELTSRYLADSSFRVAIEGEAYCRSIRQAYMDHRASHEDWLWLVRVMSQYGTEADIPCKEEGMAGNGAYIKPP